VVGGFGLGDDGVIAPCVASNGMCPPFRATAEAWRSDFEFAALDMPTDFLIAWIDVESGGNACNYTTSTGSVEAGIWQLMSPGNMQTAQTTIAEQHPSPPCASGANSFVARSGLSDAQADLQIKPGLRYVRACRDLARAQLAKYGYDWSERDWSFWAMVKMVHVAPAALGPMLQWGINANGGTPPADWDAMMVGVPTGSWPSAIPANWSANARKVGVFGQGGGGILASITGGASETETLFIVALGGLALAAWLLT
jgi:hypothetical protein